jgi:hypothetical protein
VCRRIIHISKQAYGKPHKAGNLLIAHAIRPILNSLSDYVDMIAAKRYRIYLEEERKRSDSQWMQYVIAAILWQVRLISNSFEKST